MTKSLSLDENETIRPNGKKSHDRNTVVSLLHHFLKHREENASVMHTIVEAKRKISQFWRISFGECCVVFTKKLPSVFMISGHTRSLDDGCFRLPKRRFRMSDCFSLQRLEDVVIEPERFM